ncbi:hypothetical protein GCM10010319_58710 [Streptomyces blastmyceticus]|uniref:Uncharacterized protein n=1 Tax=Streptomyces blastmyceticus TaxID=68180 RepID=A0ABN0XUB1_9ACTN
MPTSGHTSPAEADRAGFGRIEEDGKVRVFRKTAGEMGLSFGFDSPRTKPVGEPTSERTTGPRSETEGRPTLLTVPGTAETRPADQRTERRAAPPGRTVGEYAVPSSLAPPRLTNVSRSTLACTTSITNPPSTSSK